MWSCCPFGSCISFFTQLIHLINSVATVISLRYYYQQNERPHSNIISSEECQYSCQLLVFDWQQDLQGHRDEACSGSARIGGLLAKDTEHFICSGIEERRETEGEKERGNLQKRSVWDLLIISHSANNFVRPSPKCLKSPQPEFSLRESFCQILSPEQGWDDSDNIIRRLSCLLRFQNTWAVFTRWRGRNHE